MDAHNIDTGSHFGSNEIDLIAEAYDRVSESLDSSRAAKVGARGGLAKVKLAVASRDCSSVDAVVTGVLNELRNTVKT